MVLSPATRKRVLLVWRFRCNYSCPLELLWLFGRTNSWGSTEIKPLWFCVQLSLVVWRRWRGFLLLLRFSFLPADSNEYFFHVSIESVYKFADIKDMKNHYRWFHFCILIDFLRSSDCGRRLWVGCERSHHWWCPSQHCHLPCGHCHCGWSAALQWTRSAACVQLPLPLRSWDSPAGSAESIQGPGGRRDHCRCGLGHHLWRGVPPLGWMFLAAFCGQSPWSWPCPHHHLVTNKHEAYR